MRDRRVEEMLRTIEREYAYTAALTGRRAPSAKVLEAMAAVPREEFVPAEMKPHAYANNALPIGDGQTISQPFIVALMTDLLEPQGNHVILEVGTGSGYQAAVLSKLVRTVYSVEIIPALAHRAADLLQRLGCRNVASLVGDGCHGLPEHAPYDGVIVTAAAPRLPAPLVDQLRPGGRLVAPIGPPYMPQELVLLEKDAKGNIATREVLGVAFVPLTGGRAAT